MAEDKHPSHLGCIGPTFLLDTPVQDQSGSRAGTDSNVFIHDQVECCISSRCLTKNILPA